jgi:hypothetical protein
MKVGDKVEIVYLDIFTNGIAKGDKASIVDIYPDGNINIFMESGELKGQYQVCEVTDIILI